MRLRAAGDEALTETAELAVLLDEDLDVENGEFSTWHDYGLGLGVHTEITGYLVGLAAAVRTNLRIAASHPARHGLGVVADALRDPHLLAGRVEMQSLHAAGRLITAGYDGTMMCWPARSPVRPHRRRPTRHPATTHISHPPPLDVAERPYDRGARAVGRTPLGQTDSNGALPTASTDCIT